MTIKRNCVYELVTPDNNIYVGISKNLKQRIATHKRMRINSVFSDHMDKNGFDQNDFKVRVYKDDLSRKDAEKLEKELIHKNEEKGVCLNYFKRKHIKQRFEVEMPNGEIAYL